MIHYVQVVQQRNLCYNKFHDTVLQPAVLYDFIINSDVCRFKQCWKNEHYIIIFFYMQADLSPLGLLFWEEASCPDADQLRRLLLLCLLHSIFPVCVLTPWTDPHRGISLFFLYINTSRVPTQERRFILMQGQGAFDIHPQTMPNTIDHSRNTVSQTP